MKIKICGLRRPEDIDFINEFKPDYAGFILSEGFKRSVSYETFHMLRSRLYKDIKAVGVFVNEPAENILKFYACGLDVIQLHGDENNSYLHNLKNVVKCNVWKAVRVKNSHDILYADNSDADALLFDSFVENQYGGTGFTADYETIGNTNFKKPFFLAGGLNCENIENAVKKVSPFGVDISGGVETDGFKDRLKIKRIIEIVRSV